MKPEIAIIDANTLACMGLRTLIEELIPCAVVRTFTSFPAFIDDTPDMYAHYFVSLQTYFEHTSFFLERKRRTIVLVTGEQSPSLNGMLTLNISLDERQLARSILCLHQTGHPSHKHPRVMAEQPDALSPREVEVLKLVAQGMMNKEIADRLHISLTTVITHRKNIVAKLGIRSVSGLTIYAVTQGHIAADSI